MNDGRVGDEGEALSVERGEHGGPLAESEQNGFTRARCLNDGREDGASGLAEVAVRCQFGAQVGQGFDCANSFLRFDPSNAVARLASNQSANSVAPGERRNCWLV